jgi:hypothetical protein
MGVCALLVISLLRYVFEEKEKKTKSIFVYGRCKLASVPTVRLTTEEFIRLVFAGLWQQQREIYTAGYGNKAKL